MIHSWVAHENENLNKQAVKAEYRWHVCKHVSQPLHNYHISTQFDSCGGFWVKSQKVLSTIIKTPKEENSNLTVSIRVTCKSFSLWFNFAAHILWHRSEWEITSLSKFGVHKICQSKDKRGFQPLCESNLKWNESGHLSLHNLDQNDSISRPSYSQISLCKPQPSVNWVSKSQHHCHRYWRGSSRCSTEARANGANRSRCLLSPQSGNSNI